jgi:methionyl-tRNA synthetase
LRLYLVKEISYGGDGDFTWERYEERYNVDLANNFGNLVSRLAAMAEKYRQSQVKATGTGGRLAQIADAAVKKYRLAMDRLALHEGTAAAFRIIDATNEYIAEQAPWTLAKDPANATRLDETLFNVAEAIRIAATLLTPVMPSSCSEILRRVGAQGELRLDRDAVWRSQGTRDIIKGAALWPRSEEKTMDEKPIGGAGTASAPGATQAVGAGVTSAEDNRISIDEFMKVELRVARVLEAEAVPKSKKLVKLKVDVGNEQRTIVAGIAEAYQPEQLVGRTIAIVFNLKPAKLMGIESNGMVLAASVGDGRPILVSFDEPVPAGARVR